MDAVEEVKQKTDIVEIIGQYTPLTKSGKTFRGLCPFHSEKHGSFFVYPDQQRWHCFGSCAAGGDVFSFVMKKDGISFGEALKLLAEKNGIELPQNTGQEKAREKHDRLYQANQIATEYYHQLLLNSPEAQKVRNYLTKRGLNAESVENFKLGYSPNTWDSLQKHLQERGFTIEELLEAGLLIENGNKMCHDRFRNRLMFPITDIRGRIIGFGGRTLDDNIQPKYLNSPQTPLFDKSSNLYGLHLAKDSMKHEEQSVIVEGYMDVILPHQYGYKNIIASMGTAIGENHVAILKKLTKNLILALDPDSAGEAATMRSIWLENALGAEIRVALLPKGQDPDEIIIQDSSRWGKLIATAVPALDFIFEKSLTGIDLKTARGKSEAVDKLMPLVTQIKDPVRQTFYLNKLAELVRQSSKKLELLLVKNNTAQTSKTNTAKSRQAVSSHLEEYCLAIILQHPDMREHCTKLLPEYFDNSENREIYNAILSSADPSQVKTVLDNALWEHYEQLTKQTLLSHKLDMKLAETVLRMREEYIKRLAHNRADTLAVGESTQLRELFVQKEHLREQKRRQK
ncbi:MAG: DNA primase [Dehalococcoidia bacterium]|nr:DNA primase [Dehalococcoidia bacterium]